MYCRQHMGLVIVAIVVRYYPELHNSMLATNQDFHMKMLKTQNFEFEPKIGPIETHTRRSGHAQDQSQTYMCSLKRQAWNSRVQSTHRDTCIHFSPCMKFPGSNTDLYANTYTYTHSHTHIHARAHKPRQCNCRVPQ